MPQVKLDIPTKMLDEHAAAEIKRLKRQVTTLEKKLQTKESELAKIQRQQERTQRVTGYVMQLVEQIKDEYNLYPDGAYWDDL